MSAEERAMAAVDQLIFEAEETLREEVRDAVYDAWIEEMRRCELLARQHAAKATNKMVVQALNDVADAIKHGDLPDPDPQPAGEPSPPDGTGRGGR